MSNYFSHILLIIKNFERTWFCATTFSACQFKAASTEETCLLVPFGLVPTGFLIFQICFMLV